MQPSGEPVCATVWGLLCRMKLIFTEELQFLALFQKLLVKE